MRKTIVSAVAATGLAMAFGAQAQSVGEHEVGLIGQSLESGNDDMTEFGGFYNYHNFNTVDTGYLYKAGAEWTTGDESGVDSTTYDLGFTSGYRVGLSPDVTLDFLGGLGYKNWEIEENSGFESSVDSIYFRYGAGLQFEANRDNTLRLEVGSRLHLNGDYEESFPSVPTFSESIHNDNNVYAEASLLTESTGVPTRLSIFHEAKDYVVDSGDIDAYTTGLKASVIF
jgi:hypothetical protein